MNKALKTMVLTAMAAVALAVAGCTQSADELLVGSWNAKSASETVSGHPIASENTSESTSYGDALTLVYTFREDRTGTAVQTVVSAEQSVSIPFAYAVDNDAKTLTIEWQGGPDEGRAYEWTIGNVSKKDLTLSRTSKVDGTYGDELGNQIHYTVTYTSSMKFERGKK